MAFEAGKGLKDEMRSSGDLAGLGQGPDLGNERGHACDPSQARHFPVQLIRH
ncbi:hypothetical protein GCM10007872_31090 [Gluconobacter sphaericus NBRC 12467]|uniref:Uncharacterized protein n=1 Tax=Gluconobacter sphaericus NBRC 12467 TaxID=1307951 RepID=A0AA37WCS0_9PROT|nr:hypothetical protein GCM10007872_31090 [Gluconobacter sphaericus NBRC 12467]